MRIAKANTFRFFIILVALFSVAVVLSISLGVIAIPLREILTLFSSDIETSHRLIVVELRLPRTILTMSIGALLACSGAAMQGLFRNPLADPSLIGVTAGASLGASLAIFFGLSLNVLSDAAPSSMLSATTVGACVGGIISVLFTYRLATKGSATSVVTMLLAGIALTAFVGGITSLLAFFSDNETLRKLNLWRMGSLEGAGFVDAGVAFVAALICCWVLYKHANTLNAFLLGESEARHLGIRVEHAKRIFILTVAIATGLSVALAGTIAFIGLIVPHILRIFVGPDHRLLIPACALGGSILLLTADTLARLAMAPTELPVGLLTSLIGAPFFIVLLMRQQRTRQLWS